MSRDPEPTGRPWQVVPDGFLGAVAAAVPVIVFELDADGIVRRSGGLGYAALDRRPDASIGQSVFDLYQDAPAVLDASRRALSGESFTTTISIEGQGGAEVVFETTYVPVLDERQAVERVVGVALDVTARVRAQARARALFERMQSLASRLQTSREAESARIARDLHDVLGQTLTALRFEAGWLRRRMREQGAIDRGAILRRLADFDQLVDSAIENVREVTAGLRPPDLDTLGLSAAVRGAARRMTKRTGIEVSVESLLSETFERGLDFERSTAAFRIIQEALTNVVRHAEATVATVRLIGEVGEEGPSLLLTVEDDGCGIDDGALRTGALGMLGMEERARAWGGHLCVENRPRGGTVVRAFLPLAAEARRDVA